MEFLAKITRPKFGQEKITGNESYIEFQKSNNFPAPK
jgi:hypothetical protein